MKPEPVDGAARPVPRPDERARPAPQRLLRWQGLAPGPAVSAARRPLDGPPPSEADREAPAGRPAEPRAAAAARPLPDVAVDAAPRPRLQPLHTLRALHATPSPRRRDDEALAPGTSSPQGAAVAAATAVAPPVADDTPPQAALPALVAAHCERLWVSDDRGGVLLDLGRWLPGCSVELARRGGALYVTFRGVEPERCAALERDAAALADGLARHLGCAVVAAVEGRPR
jgi:hypothetical protein